MAAASYINIIRCGYSTSLKRNFPYPGPIRCMVQDHMISFPAERRCYLPVAGKRQLIRCFPCPEHFPRCKAISFHSLFSGIYDRVLVYEQASGLCGFLYFTHCQRIFPTGRINRSLICVYNRITASLRRYFQSKRSRRQFHNIICLKTICQIINT